MNKYFNVSLTKSYKSDMNNYNYNFDVASRLPPAATYFPLTNTATNPVYQNNGNTGQTIKDNLAIDGTEKVSSTIRINFDTNHQDHLLLAIYQIPL